MIDNDFYVSVLYSPINEKNILIYGDYDTYVTILDIKSGKAIKKLAGNRFSMHDMVVIEAPKIEEEEIKVVKPKP